ncbi:hypothetical protein [Nostoc commune]|uniref:hypothetical protein n=1 Tax=Nostoc commune TaxID=1178 RepID=UPI0018C51AEA|nr:hypothetical protein [Nostoc commune]
MRKSYLVQVRERFIELTLNQSSQEAASRSLIADFWRSDFGDLQLEHTPTQEQATHSAS